MTPFLSRHFPYARPPELDGNVDAKRSVVIVGAGPVGLTLALDWARKGHDVLILTAGDQLSEGSRAICFAKRTLEIFDRLGCGDPVVERGVSWNLGKVFLRDRMLYEFNLLPEAGHQRPAFVNIQQYHVERFLLDALAEAQSADDASAIELRWGNRVTGVTQRADAQGDVRVDVAVECPDGAYTLSCDWLIACDGAGSPIRKAMGLKSEGQVFQDRFLIADVKMQGLALAAFGTERRFWFDPPFHRNQSALLHRQADDVWRLDFQLGWQADPDVERQPARVTPRIRAMLGDGVDFTLEWVSVYTFQCRRMEKFVHDRVIFAGDAAHQVSPFGARGANSGIQDADNLSWKLDLIVRGLSPPELLASYDAERSAAADENIANSTRSTDFITPKNEASRTFRDATLELAARYPFARRLVNSGRLSVPAHYASSPLNTPDSESWPAPTPPPGSPAPDAPVTAGGRESWLLQHLCAGFTVLVFVSVRRIPEALVDAVRILQSLPIAVSAIAVARDDAHPPVDFTVLRDPQGIAWSRYVAGSEADAIYLLRPDQHIAGRRQGLDPEWLGAALRTACRTEISFNAGIC